jgi:transcriptional regulator with XRE-family HTH domain
MTTVGPLLRGWRERRRISQLELSLRADSSARHISFIETGRARPSQAMVLRLAEHLEVPVRERNALLLAAGYAPAYPETPLDDPAMSALRAGIEQLLTGYEPYPALVMNGGTTVPTSYDSADRLTATGYTYDAFGRATSLPGSVTVGYYANDVARQMTTASQRSLVTPCQIGRAPDSVAAGDVGVRDLAAAP